MLLITAYIIALFITSLGFIKFIYFISISYGFSVASIGIFLFFKIKKTPIQILFSLLYIVYGLRLGLFILIREFDEHYNKKIFQGLLKTNQTPIVKKIIIWVLCALLYTLQTSPLTFRIMSDGNDNDILSYIGFAISIFGFIFEIKADREKSNAKKINPKRFVDTGLYRIVRCANYFGEVIFWTGNFIAGLQIYEGAFQWLMSIFGYILIIYIMFSGARRLEIRHDEYYGKDPDYQKYKKATPILIPFLPLYSVKKYTWLRG